MNFRHIISVAVMLAASNITTIAHAATDSEATDSTTSKAPSAEATPSHDKYDMENGVLPIADDRGFTLQSKDGKFAFKPYMMLQANLAYRYYDDVGLDKAYNQDNVANSGFAVPYAIIGFTGKAFGKIDYNICINAAGSGGNILQQAWIDYAVSPALRFRVGKQKTPFTGAYLTTLGETLFPALPTSLTSTVIMPYSLNAPSLLYAARLTWQPKGAMPMTQGNSKMLNLDKMLIGISANFNNEAESESTNDFRAGVEFAWLKNRWYLAAEAYYMHVGFTKRQKISESYNFWGGYAQAAYFVTRQLQLGLRYDVMDRNGSAKDGLLNSPAIAINYFVPKTNIKISGYYQFTGRWGHATQLDRDLDELGLSKHTAMVMLQYAF